MSFRSATLDAQLAAIDAAVGGVSHGSARRATVERFRADLAAARFHLRRPSGTPPIVAIMGGTGTGKSTLLNRLAGSDIAAASFRRTFTAGPIAVTSDHSHVPDRWLGVEHLAIPADQLPARGQLDRLAIVVTPNNLTQKVTLIDTPDLDGDQPAHHAQADRVFRWADAVLFLVTPEKYQMTELLPYYRLAKRYGLVSLHVMNKAEEQPPIDDYRQQLDVPQVFAIPRDDAAFEPAPEINLPSLQNAIGAISIDDRSGGNAMRAVDLMERLRDQIVEPAAADRREIDRLVSDLRGMETPAPGVDVNPLTQQLQRRLQQRSVLYLIGPGRVLDRVRQVPAILARLPRTTWDLLRTGRSSSGGNENVPPDLERDKPQFRAALVDQFAVVQSRIDDAIRSSATGLAWIEQAAVDYAGTRLDPDMAGQIADEEMARLQHWLEKQWNATPRDTAIIERLLKVLPGGKKLTKWSEAAPYILAIVVATHHVFFGHIDLLILGGYSLATWLTEKISNEVAARARAANNAIAARFTELAHKQIQQTCGWLEQQAPDAKSIRKLSDLADRVSELLQQNA